MNNIVDFCVHYAIIGIVHTKLFKTIGVKGTKKMKYTYLYNKYGYKWEYKLNEILWNEIIRKWKNISNNRPIAYYGEKRAFCKEYKYDGCYQCPIFKLTNSIQCKNTLFRAFFLHLYTCKKCNKEKFCSKGVSIAKEFLKELKKLKKQWEKKYE